MLPVIIRAYPDGETIALFPTLAANLSNYYVSAYVWRGGHTSADYSTVIRQTTPASQEQTEQMLNWLSLAGYVDLKVYQRYQRDFTIQFDKSRRVPEQTRLGREFSSDYELITDTVYIIETLTSNNYMRPIAGIHCMFVGNGELWIHHGAVPYDDSLYERVNVDGIVSLIKY